MENNELLQELEKHYNALLRQREIDGDINQRAITSYFRFIEETPILRGIATSLFSSPSSPSVIRNDVNDFYQINILNNQNYSNRRPIGTTGLRVTLFHDYLVKGARQFGLTNKRKIILHKERSDNRVCLISEKLLCYSIKGEKPERFNIILNLFEVETGKSAREIANLLSKNGKDKIVQDHIKKEIEEINMLFMQHCCVPDNLISHNKFKGKNIYFLNRKQFAFELEK